MAIEFNKKVLEQLAKLKKFNLEFAKVIYDKNEQERYVERTIKENLKRMEETGVGHVALELNTNFRMEISFYKTSQFCRGRRMALGIKFKAV